MQTNVNIVPPSEVQNIRTPKQPIPNATPTLVLGIIALVFCWMSLFAIIGIVLSIIGLSMGSSGLRQYKSNPEAFDDSNLGQLKAGRVCCIVALSITGFLILLVLAFFGIVAAAGGF